MMSKVVNSSSGPIHWRIGRVPRAASYAQVADSAACARAKFQWFSLWIVPYTICD
jgi:hypothetical protein